MDRVTPEEVRAAYLDPAVASRYAGKHRRTWLRRLAARREARLVRAALRHAGGGPLLDLPCGTGRFLGDLHRCGAVVAGDQSPAMVAEARRAAPRTAFVLAASPKLPFRTGAFGAVACLRFLHHLATDADRARALAELARVSRGPIVVSLFLAGNRQARRRAAKDARRGASRRFVLPRAALERLAREAGLRVRTARPLFPALSALAVLTLERDSAA